MGCICSKGIPPEEKDEAEQQKGSTISLKHVPSRKVEVTTAYVENGTNGSSRRQISSLHDNNVTPPPLSADEGKSRLHVHVVVDPPMPQKVTGHQRRATVDVGTGDTEPIIKITHVPSAFEAEQVAAGWPSWLASVAGEAIKGWLPRRADTFEKFDKIGQGTYSIVYKARDLETGKIVALKKVRFVNMDRESVRFMAREIHILRRLDHPNIVKLEGLIASTTSSSLYLVFEYMEHDLAGLVATPGIKFTEPQIKCYMQQLLSGLDHCHSRGILHRDIKGSNLLIDNNGILRIADFGLATLFDPDQKQPLTSRVVTLWYRPPELLLGATQYGVAVDLWSAGCIVAELLAGKPIMPGRTEVEQMHKIFKLCGSPPEEYWGESKLPHATIFKPQHPYQRCVRETFKDFPSSSLDLLDILLAIKPEDRGTAASALSREFFTSKPYACDPSTLPKYPPSKEFDAKLRDEEARRQRAADNKRHGSESVRVSSRGTTGMTDHISQFESSLQKRKTQQNYNSSNEKIDPLGDGIESDDQRKATTLNNFSHFGSSVHPSAVGSTWPNNVREGDLRRAPSRSSITVRGLNGPELRTQRSHMPQSGVGDLSNLLGLVSAKTNAKSENHRERTKQPHWPEHRLDVEQEWGHQILDRPSSSHKKDERIGAKEPASGYGAKNRRIHYSGPLMPPGGNLEEMLKEHERQIQQAVRKARLDKAKTKDFGD